MPEIVGLVLRLTMDTVCDTDQKKKDCVPP